MHQDSAVIRRAMRKVAIDHTHGFEAFERLAQFDCRERPEPAKTDKTDFVAFLPQTLARRAARRTDGAESDQDRVRIICHELREERTRVAFPENGVELPVSFLDDSSRAAGGIPVLAAQFHDPGFIDLRSNRDWIVGMQSAVTEIIRRQKLPNSFGGWNFYHMLRVR